MVLNLNLVLILILILVLVRVPGFRGCVAREHGRHFSPGRSR